MIRVVCFFGQQVGRARRGCEHKSQSRSSCRCLRQTPVHIWLTNCSSRHSASQPLALPAQCRRALFSSMSLEIDDGGDIGNGREN